MPAVSLPLLPDDEVSICPVAEGLDIFLAPVNDPGIVARLGAETIVLRQADLLITQGERFGSKSDWTQGMRYIRLDPASQTPLAVLNVSIKSQDRKKQAVASNIYVCPEYRRQGLGAGLLLRAQQDFPRLAASGTLSALGAELVGRAPKPPRYRGLSL